MPAVYRALTAATTAGARLCPATRALRARRTSCGTIRGFFATARSTFQTLMRICRSVNSSMVNLARLIGPSIAGVVIAPVGEGWCFFIDGVSYIAVIVGLLRMRIVRREAAPPRRIPSFSGR